MILRNSKEHSWLCHWMIACAQYLTDVLEVFNIVSLCAHDLINDVSPHLVSVLKGWAQAQAVIGRIQVPVLHLAGPLGRLSSTVLLVHPQLRTNAFTHKATAWESIWVLVGLMHKSEGKGLTKQIYIARFIPISTRRCVKSLQINESLIAVA